jgi:hypothetical protein
MAKRLTRASLARLAVGMAALALPLFAVGTAQAAIAGAPAESTTTQPDLVSATALNAATVAFCFDKPLNTTNQVFASGNFSIGGYRAANTQTSSSVTAGPGTNCLTATFSSVGDINSYSYARVAANSVSTGTGGTANSQADSTALLSSTSKSGTTGFTVAPDLLLATPNPGPGNTMTFVEDQQVAAAVAPPAGDFTFTSSVNGLPGPTTTICTATGVAISGSTVTVAFNPNPAGFPLNACLVTNAVRATQFQGALFASADPAIPNPQESAVVAGTVGTPTTAPNLVPTSDPSPVAVPGGTDSTITFTFDKAVGIPTIASSTRFYAVLSTGAEVFSTSAVLGTGTNTVVATFPGMQSYANYVVGAGVLAGTVNTGGVPVQTNGDDYVKAGDNASGFARGFTTAPDAVLAFPIAVGSFNQIELVVDQPATSFNPADFLALDGTGATITSAGFPNALLPPTPTLSAQTITLTFAPTTATTIKNLALVNGALAGPALPGVAPTGGSQASIDQVLSVTSTATLLHREKLARNQHHLSKHALKAHQAKVRKQEKRLLRQLSRKVHHKV